MRSGMSARRNGGVALPAIWFVILNWNQTALTVACLRSIQRLEGCEMHVVLVDNGSRTKSADVFRAHCPEINLIVLERNVGYSGGNNVGMRYALECGADYICLLNNDTEVAPDMLRQLVATSESDRRIGITGPTMYYADPPDLIWGGENHIDWATANLRRIQMGTRTELSLCQVREVDYIDTCAALIKREVLERIGLMDERYHINFDDVDLNVRAHKAGYRSAYVPAARMWHKVSATMGPASPATTYYMTRNAMLFFWENAPARLRAPAVARIFLRTVRTLAAWSLKPTYRIEVYRRRRDANLLALRDFIARRFGPMGQDVARVCGVEGMIA